MMDVPARDFPVWYEFCAGDRVLVTNWPYDGDVACPSSSSVHLHCLRWMETGLRLGT